MQRSITQHGKVLGGSSCLNWMSYVRGHKSDYDSWERLGCTNWGWRNVEKYFKRMEDYSLTDGKHTDSIYSYRANISAKLSSRFKKHCNKHSIRGNCFTRESEVGKLLLAAGICHLSTHFY